MATLLVSRAPLLITEFEIYKFEVAQAFPTILLSPIPTLQIAAVQLLTRLCSNSCKIIEALVEADVLGSTKSFFAKKIF